MEFRDEAGASRALALNGTAGAAGGQGPWSGQEVSVRRATAKAFRLVDQPNRVCVKDLPDGASDRDILAFLGVEAAGMSDREVARLVYRPRTAVRLAVVSLASPAVAQATCLARNSQVLTVGASGATGIVRVEPSRKREWEGVSRLQDPDDAEPLGHLKSNAGGASRPKDCMTVWVGGLPRDAEENDVRGVLAQCGPLAAFRFIRSRTEGDFLGFCFAQYEQVAGVEAAVKLNGQHRLGCRLKVHYAVDRRGA